MNRGVIPGSDRWAAALRRAVISLFVMVALLLPAVPVKLPHGLQEAGLLAQTVSLKALPQSATALRATEVRAVPDPVGATVAILPDGGSIRVAGGQGVSIEAPSVNGVVRRHPPRPFSQGPPTRA